MNNKDLKEFWGKCEDAKEKLKKMGNNKPTDDFNYSIGYNQAVIDMYEFALTLREIK